MNSIIPLCALQPGERATVQRLNNPDHMRRRLLDIGLVPDCTVECVGRSPGGDPCAYRICRAVIALRQEDSRLIWVRRQEGEDTHGPDQPFHRSRSDG